MLTRATTSGWKLGDMGMSSLFSTHESTSPVIPISCKGPHGTKGPEGSHDSHLHQPLPFPSVGYLSKTWKCIYNWTVDARDCVEAVESDCPILLLLHTLLSNSKVTKRKEIKLCKADGWLVRSSRVAMKPEQSPSRSEALGWSALDQGCWWS